MNAVEREELFDLLCHRYFHASIFSRDTAPRHEIEASTLLQEMWIATALRAKSDPFDLTEGVAEGFVGSATGRSPSMWQLPRLLW